MMVEGGSSQKRLATVEMDDVGVYKAIERADGLGLDRRGENLSHKVKFGRSR